MNCHIYATVKRRLTMKHETDVYGYVNGEPVYSREEFVYRVRRFGPIKSDAELLAFAKKRTSDWCSSGQKQKFEGFYLSDYALSEPRRSLTDDEFNRLKELQKQARVEAKKRDDARRWRYIKTSYYADNSVEEIWEDKDGNRKTVTVIGPHGDAC